MSDDLIAGIVRVLDPNGTTAGTGFVITEYGLIATCAHVVEAAGAGPDDQVTVVFYTTGDTRQAQVESEYWRNPDAEDMAILRLQGSVPDGVTPLLLGSSRGTSGHPFETFGFPNAKSVEGMWGYGTIGGETTEEGHRVLQLTDTTEVTPGFSGAPVLDTVTRRVVGMVTAITAPDPYGRLTETAFIIPTETLRAVCPVLQVSGVCPYRSLDVFTEVDAELFFGRQRVVERLVESLRREPRFLAVLGPSGSGKSSLMQAGLIPQLRKGAVPGSERWEVIVTRPTDQPFHQLEAQGLTVASEGLAAAAQAWLDDHREQKRLVLVVDQFEELLVTCSEEFRRDFVAQLMELLEASLPVTVVLVMRDDFYSRFTREARALLPWLERGLVNVPLTLERDELRAIVEEPARAVGLAFERGLVEAILEDTLEAAPEGAGRAGRSTILPLLEFALTQLWERRQDGVLTHEAYGAIGGVTGSLTQWANRAFYRLGKEQQRLARRVLPDLVHLGDESQGLPDSRRRRSLAALYRDESEREAVQGIVQRLADARLLVAGRDLQSGQETVELIHDALRREWGLLQGWLQEDRRFLAWRQVMEGEVWAWVETNPDNPVRRDAGWLLRGRELAEAERWLTARRDNLRAEERAFIESSAARASQVRQLTVGGIVCAFLIVSLLALMFLWQRNAARHAEATAVAEADARATAQIQAEERRQEAEAAKATAVVEAQVRATAQAQTEEQRQIAVARQLAAQAQIVLDNTGTGLVRSALWAVESLCRYPSLEGDQALRRGLSLLPRPMGRMEHGWWVETVAFSPDGQWVASGSGDGTARVWETATGKEVAQMEHEGAVLAVAFSPDGQWVTSGSEDNTVRVWEAATGEEVARMVHGGAVSAVAFSPDGWWVASGSEDNTVRVWEAVTGREVVRMAHVEAVLAVAFSPDGRWVASGSEDNTVRVWEAATGEEVARMMHGGAVSAVAFSPDGWRVASASWDRTVRVWEAATEEEVVRMAHQDWAEAVAFSPDGRWVASGSRDHTVRVWEAATGEEVARMVHERYVWAVAFSPDGRWVASGGQGGTVHLWEAATGGEVAQMVHEWWVEAVAFSPDGRWVASGSRDRTARVWEAATGEETAWVAHENWVEVVAFSPDGRWVASGSRDNTARVWEAATGEEVARMEHEDAVFTLAFSSDGRWLATGSRGGTARVWEAATGEEVARMVHEGMVWAVTFSPDGQWVASGSKDDTARVWKAATGEEVARMVHEHDVQAVAFGPDGQWVASGDQGGTVHLWEAATGEEVAQMEHGWSVSVVDFSSDGKWLTTGSCDNTARVWEAATGREVARMEHEDWVEAVAFSPDGRWVVSGSRDNTARVWEAATGEEVARMVHEWWVEAVAFSPDGRWVASGSGDNTARVWLWRPEDLIGEACVRLPRNLTLGEWKRYLGDEPYRPTCPNLPAPGE